jgi:hypothetical protein
MHHPVRLVALKVKYGFGKIIFYEESDQSKSDT